MKIKNNINKSFGSYVRRIRLELGIGQRELAEKIGIAASYLNDIENFIYIIPTGSRATIRGTFPVWEYKQNDAVLYGFDYDLNFDISENLSFNQKIS